ENQCRGAGAFEPTKARKSFPRFEAKVPLLVVLHTVSKRSEVLYRRGACIRIAAPRPRLREGRIRRSSQLPGWHFRPMVRARSAGTDFVADDRPERPYPAWEVPARAYGSPMLHAWWRSGPGLTDKDRPKSNPAASKER